jgi:HlyD family secretion protein
MNCKSFALSLLMTAAAIATLPARAEDAPAAGAPAAAQTTTGAEAAKATPERPVPAVSVVIAGVADMSQKVIVTGTLVAREQVLVTPGVEGLKIETINFDAGETVEEGAVLARLSVDSIDVLLAQNTSQLAATAAQVAQSQAQIAAAEASATQANAALKRTRTLTTRGVSAQDALDQRQSAADQANAQLQVARQGLVAAEASRKVVEAQRAELELRRSKTDIKAPKSGLILARNAVVGQVASAAGNPLFVIAENGDIELDADVTETVLPSLKVGQPVAVQPSGVGEPIVGIVRLIQPEVNATTRLGKARVVLPHDDDLRVGTFARGTVEIARSRGVVLPVTAVADDSGDKSVQVVNDGVVETHEVETGLTDAGLVEIRSGIEEGEMVVSKAGTFLRAGDKVKPLVVTGQGAKG